MITLVMPAFNEEKNIKKSIESIKKQTFENFELIIVNDGSTDNTVTVIEREIENDPRIKFINPKKKLGKNGAINVAFEYIRGDWLYFMGADDILPSNALYLWDKATSNLNPSEPLALRGRMKITSDMKKYDGLILPKNRKKVNLSGPLLLQSRGMFKFTFPLPEEFPNEDTWWSLCINAFAHQIICIDDIIVYYNIHDGNSISRNDSYAIFTEKYHRRYIARKKFLESFENIISKKYKMRLENELYMEELRWNKKTLKIIFLRNVSIIDKLRCIVFSNKCLYTIKIKFDRFFLGH